MDSLVGPAAHDDDLARRRQLLAEAIERFHEDLFVAARIYASRLALPSHGETVAEVAEELVQAMVVRAFEIADRFDPTRLPRPWLLALLTNVTKEERKRRYRDRRRASSIREAANTNDSDDAAAGLSEYVLLDRLRLRHGQRHGEADPAAKIHAEELLRLVSERDREVLRLAVVEGHRGRDVAARLGISEGAANVRLHRALGHLRTAYDQLDDQTKRA